MKKSILYAVLLVMMINVTGQNPYLELIFTAIDNTTSVQLDSIKIMNRTQYCDTTLYSPDTLLLLGSDFGTNEYSGPGNGLKVFQNYPNPVFDNTTIPIYIPDKDELKIVITDVLGRVIVKSEMELEKGMHSFRYAPCNTGIIFFTTQWRGETKSIRMLSTVSQATAESSVEYIGSEATTISRKTFSAMQNFTFSFGDELLYIGYTNNLQSGILDAPDYHETYTFQFATNIPCLGTPTVTYEGVVYNTIQVFSQCWLKENLNIGAMITANEPMTDNGIIEKYCYNDDHSNCEFYGGLYRWNEIMQYNTTLQSTQGICPPGWHLPSDEEWNILEGVLDSQYKIGDTIWDFGGNRGIDAGFNIKSSYGWSGNNNGGDLYGFSVLPGGMLYDTIFYGVSVQANYWTTTSFTNSAYNRQISLGDYIYKASYIFSHGFSIRCIKD